MAGKADLHPVLLQNDMRPKERVVGEPDVLILLLKHDHPVYVNKVSGIRQRVPVPLPVLVQPRDVPVSEPRPLLHRPPQMSKLGQLFRGLLQVPLKGVGVSLGGHDHLGRLRRVDQMRRLGLKMVGV